MTHDLILVLKKSESIKDLLVYADLTTVEALLILKGHYKCNGYIS